MIDESHEEELRDLILSGKTFPYEFLISCPKYSPVFYELEDLMSQLEDGGINSEYESNHTHLSRVLDELKRTERFKGINPLEGLRLDSYLSHLRKFITEAENLPDKYKAEHQIRAKLLYGDKSNKELRLKGSDKILLSFGRKI